MINIVFNLIFLEVLLLEKENLSNRQLLLLLKLKVKKYTTAQELADSMNISVRTIKNEVSILKNILNKSKISLEAKSGYGYRIEIQDQNYFNSLIENIHWIGSIENQQFLKNNFNRIIYIIRELILTEGYTKIDELANKLFVSRATLKNDFIEVRNLLEKYRIQIIAKPKYGIKVDGSEFDLRMCISEYFFYQSIANMTSKLEKEESILLKIEETLIEKSSQNNILLSEFSIKNIAVHIYISIKRNQKGFIYQNGKTELYDFSSKKIFQTAESVYEDLKKKLSIVISEREVNYLATHLDSKQIVEDISADRENDRKVIKNILDEIQRNFDLDFSNDLILNKFLLQHIPQMVKRIRKNLVIRNPFLQENMRKYLFALKITESAVGIIEIAYQVKIPLDEFGYLMFYFQTALNKLKRRRKINIGFIMGRGRSESLVYQQEIRSALPEEGFTLQLFQSLADTQQSEKNIDIIVSVFHIQAINFKYNVTIESGNYIEKIKKIANTIEIEEVNLDKYFKEEYFITSLKGNTKEEIYQNILTILDEKEVLRGEVKDNYPFISQEIGNEMVHLQDLYKYCKKPIGFVGILENPIIWEKSMVKVIFLIKTKRDGDVDLPIICQIVSNFISNPKKVSNLKEERNFKQFRMELVNNK